MNIKRQENGPRSDSHIAVHELTEPQTIIRTEETSEGTLLLVAAPSEKGLTPDLRSWWVKETPSGEYHVLSYAGMLGSKDPDKVLQAYLRKGLILAPFRHTDITDRGGIHCEHEYGYDEEGRSKNIYTYTKDNRKAVADVYDERPDDPSMHTRQNCTLDLYENGKPYGRTRTYNYADNARIKAVRFVAGDLDENDARRLAAGRQPKSVEDENRRIITEITGEPYMPYELSTYADSIAPFDLLENTDHEQVRAYVTEYVRLNKACEEAMRRENEEIEPFDKWRKENHVDRFDDWDDVADYPRLKELRASVDALTAANDAMAEGLRKVVAGFNGVAEDSPAS